MTKIEITIKTSLGISELKKNLKPVVNIIKENFGEKYVKWRLSDYDLKKELIGK